VLWEMSRDGAAWRGLTDNYLTVTATSQADLANRITQTRLVRAVGQVLQGEVILAGMS
jgi:hypothetical protein